MSPHVPPADDDPVLVHSSRPARLLMQRGAFGRSPSGGSGGKGPVEDCQGMSAAGFEWYAPNYGDSPPPLWATWRRQARLNYLAWVPWARCHTLEDVALLLEQADDNDADAVIVNLEQEDGVPRWLIAMHELANLLRLWPYGIGICTEPWLPLNAEWERLNRLGCVCLPQAFLNTGSRWIPNAVVWRARERFARVSPVFGAYPSLNPVDPASYLRLWDGDGFGVYCADDVPSWPAWEARGD